VANFANVELLGRLTPAEMARRLASAEIFAAASSVRTSTPKIPRQLMQALYRNMMRNSMSLSLRPHDTENRSVLPILALGLEPWATRIRVTALSLPRP